MRSSSDDESARALAAAQRLSGERVVAFDALARSGNNRIFHVRTPRATFALKAYAGGAGAGLRLRREYDALVLLTAAGGAHDVPRPVGVDQSTGHALYEWIEGTPVTQACEQDVDAALAFLKRTHTLCADVAAAALLPAAEAFSSGADLFAGLRVRIDRLILATAQDEDARRFVSEELAPELDRLAIRCRGAMPTTAAAFGSPLLPSAQTLSPSDFSLHNTLRRPDGTLVFLDFEYFGWDDPVKLTSDFLWHPAMQLTSPLADRFRRGATQLYVANDAAFEDRLRIYFPVFGLKWCLIMLNEFLGDDWSRRRFAGQQRSRDDVKATQIAKARRAFAEVARQTREAVG